MLYKREKDAPADLDADEIEAYEHDELWACDCGCGELYTAKDDGTTDDYTGHWFADGHEPEGQGSFDPRSEYGTYWAQGGSVVG